MTNGKLLPGRGVIKIFLGSVSKILWPQYSTKALLVLKSLTWGDDDPITEFANNDRLIRLYTGQ